MRLALALACLLCAAAAQAQVYRWVDEKGTVHYSNNAPPAGTRHTVVDIEAKPGPPAADTTECHTVRCQGERMERRIERREALEDRAAARRAATTPQARGMTMRTFLSLQRGMTESELVVNAGRADAVFTDRGTRTYTWLPTVNDPFTTVATVFRGRVTELERIRKF